MKKSKIITCRPIEQYHEGGDNCSCVPIEVDSLHDERIKKLNNLCFPDKLRKNGKFVYNKKIGKPTTQVIWDY